MPAVYSAVYNQPILRGSTSKSVFIQITNVTGVPRTGLTSATVGLVASYAGSKLARVAITLVDLALITTDWTSGGFKEVDATNMPGLYRVDVPNAALALTADEVTIEIKNATLTQEALGSLVVPIPTATVGSNKVEIDEIQATQASHTASISAIEANSNPVLPSPGTTRTDS